MNIRKPLLDKTLVITRSFEQSEPLSSELVDLGAKIISLPLITIAEPTDNGKGLEEKVKDFEAYKWVVATSPNGAMRLLKTMELSLIHI